MTSQLRLRPGKNRRSSAGLASGAQPQYVRFHLFYKVLKWQDNPLAFPNVNGHVVLALFSARIMSCTVKVILQTYVIVMFLKHFNEIAKK